MKKFLVPVDFSDHSARATRYAIDLAQAVGAELLLYHSCFDPLIDSDLPTWRSSGEGGQAEMMMTSVEQEARRHMSQLEADVRHEAGPQLTVSSLVELGFAERRIPEVALRDNCDLIVIASRGKSNLYKTFFGSVTAEVMQRAQVPVLVIPEGVAFRPFQHVMYASDFDPADGWVVRQMLETLQPLQFDLYSVFIYNDHGHPYRKEDYHGLKEALHSHMQHVLPDARMEIVATGDSDLLQGLDRQLDENHVDLLVMTTHARNFINRLMQPSQARRMAFHTHTPLMVFRVIE